MGVIDVIFPADLMDTIDKGLVEGFGGKFSNVHDFYQIWIIKVEEINYAPFRPEEK